jgi:hypothetical protein
MAREGKQKRKIYFTVSEPGELKFKNVSAGKFTKKVRKHKATRNLQFVKSLGLEPMGKIVYDA